MGAEPLLSYSELNRPSAENGGLWGSRSGCGKEYQSLRISKLDFNEINVPLEPFYNETLLSIICSYDESFDVNQEIEENKITDVLLNEVARIFNCKVDDISLDKFYADNITIARPLRYNVYDLNFNPFLSLRYENEKLYKFLCEFYRSLNIPCVEEEETGMYCEEYTETYNWETDEIEEPNLYASDLDKLKELRESLKAGEIGGNFIEELKAYKPRKAKYKQLKEFMLQWYGDTSFFDRIITNETNHAYYDADNGEIISLSSVIYKSFVPECSGIRKIVNESLTNCFNNDLPQQPNDFIHANKKFSSIMNDDVEQLEKFVTHFCDVQELY